MRRSVVTGTRRIERVRCAIYTRKSSEERLDQEFNSLQAQREACEAFINSQRHEGWVCLPAAYNGRRLHRRDNGSAGLATAARGGAGRTPSSSTRSTG